MTKPNDAAYVCPDGWTRHCGLTKRELFAAMAMQAIWACPKQINKTESMGERDIAKMAVIQANALIAALNEETK